MATNVIMPKQGLQMTEGTITQWLVGEGETCEQGKPLFEMETDKLTVAIDAPQSGTLLKIVRGAGDVVPVADVIAIIGNAGESIAEFSEIIKETKEDKNAEAKYDSANVLGIKTQSGGKTFASPRARMRAQDANVDISLIEPGSKVGMVIERDVISYINSGKQKATPLAKKIAAQMQIELEGLKGSGAKGKITKADVLSNVQSVCECECECKAGAQNAGTKLIPLTGMRKTIAARMNNSQATCAQTTHKISVDMTNATMLRNDFKSAGKKVSFNDLIVKATSIALCEFPMMNSEWTDEGILVKSYVNMGIAVAIDDGLVVPAVKNSGKLRLEEISSETKELAGRAKNGTLTGDDCSDATFTISNLGMYGLDSFVAIINHPQAGILAVGAIEKKPVVRDDEMVIRSIMSLTLSYDHRIIDGAPAAMFLKTIKEYLESPYLML